jgi:hypothetical protein
VLGLPSLTLPSSRSAKLRLAPALEAGTQGLFFDCEYHGLGVRFHCDSSELLEKLRSWVPAPWRRRAEPGLSLHWWDAQRLWPEDEGPFDEDADPRFEVRGEVIVQRDFMARRLGCSGAAIAVRTDSTDGFFNALRFFLPQALFSRGALVLHSAAVVGHDGRARIFLGHSGAGKTTVASLAENRPVLGDDITLARVTGTGLTVEPALLGQKFWRTDWLGRPAEVAGLYWLTKADDVSLRKLSPAELARALVHSVLLPEPRLAGALMEAVGQLGERVPGFELSFRKDPAFWEVVDG